MTTMKITRGTKNKCFRDLRPGNIGSVTKTSNGLQPGTLIIKINNDELYDMQSNSILQSPDLADMPVEAMGIRKIDFTSHDPEPTEIAELQPMQGLRRENEGWLGYGIALGARIKDHATILMLGYHKKTDDAMEKLRSMKKCQEIMYLKNDEKVMECDANIILKPMQS